MNKQVLELITQRTLLDDRERRMRIVARRMKDVLKDVDLDPPHCLTGWFALFRRSKEATSGFEFLGFFNPDESDESEEKEWDIALPIPLIDELREFAGW